MKLPMLTVTIRDKNVQIQTTKKGTEIPFQWGQIPPTERYPFPQGVKIRLSDRNAPYQPGYYVPSPQNFQVNQYSDLEFRGFFCDLEPYPDAQALTDAAKAINDQRKSA